MYSTCTKRNEFDCSNTKPSIELSPSSVPESSTGLCCCCGCPEGLHEQVPDRELKPLLHSTSLNAKKLLKGNPGNVFGGGKAQQVSIFSSWERNLVHDCALWNFYRLQTTSSRISFSFKSYLLESEACLPVRSYFHEVVRCGISEGFEQHPLV